MLKLLLIEDDPDLAQLIASALEKEHYSVDLCSDGETGMLYALNPDYGYDLAIIDRMLPVIDGLSIVRAMRRKGIQLPVLMITALGGLDDRVEGLDGGADDYLVKPFHLRELSARVRALTRRPQTFHEQQLLQYGDLTLDEAARTLSFGAESLQLTAKEAALLATLMQHPETLQAKERLLLRVWGSDTAVESGNLDNYISFLRKRLRALGSRCVITTVYGSGYLLEVQHHA